MAKLNLTNIVDELKKKYQTTSQNVSSGLKNYWGGVKQRYNEGGGISQFTPLSMRSQIVPSTMATAEGVRRIFNTNPQKTYQTAQDIGYGLRGALSLTPFQSVKTITPKLQQIQNISNPQTFRQQSAQSIGRGIYGSMLTAPLAGGALGVAKNAIVGTGLGVGMGVGIDLITGQKITKQRLAEHALSGFENSWVLPITNAFTNKALSITGARNLVGKNITAPFANGQVKQGLARVFTRALAEVPAENTAFTWLGRLDDTSKESFMKDWMMNLPGNVVSNLAFAGAQGSWNIAINKEARQAINKALQSTIRGWTRPIVTMELDSKGRRITLPYWQYQIKKSQPGGLSVQDVSKLSPEDYTKITGKEAPNVPQAGLYDEAGKYNTADEFFLYSKKGRELLREQGIKSQEAIKEWFNKNATPKNVLETLNPTGTVNTEYAPQSRATMPLDKNITTLDKTMGKAPNDTITIYRGVPNGVNKINPGDFITTDPQLAKTYTGDGNVVSMKVKYSDILDDVTESGGGEYIYRPNVVQQPIGDVKANVVEPEAKIVPSSPTQIMSSKPTALQTSDSGLVQTQQPKVTTQKPLQESKQIQSQSGDLNDQKIKTYKFNILDRLYTEFANRFHPLSKLAKSGGKDAELNRKIAGYYGSGSTADYHLNFELSPILKGQNLDDLKSASIAMRDIELASRKIKGSPEQANATKILDNLKAKYGEDGMKKLGETLNALYKYQDDIARKYLVDTGIMSNASYEKMRGDNSFYVPFKRVSDKMDEFLGIPTKRGAGSVGSQNVIFKIKGSDKELIDPIESIIENTYKMVSLGKRQQLAQTIAGLSKELPELVQKTNISGMKNTISVFENGKKVNYLVPEEVADAARGMSEESLVMLAKILKVPTDLFRTMTTGINPEFLLPNVSRDVQSAIFNTGTNPLKWVAGLYHYAKQDAVYQDFLKAGGKTSRVSINRPFLKQTAQEVSGQGFKIKSPKDIIRGLEMLSQYSEQPTRISVFQDAYKKALKKGFSQEDALSEAAYWAQEGTVNFARRGSKMPNINAIYAYLNARIQGIDRMFRTIKKEPGKASLRFGISFLAPSLALYAWNSRNPDYYNERILSKRDKQDNFIFMLPKPVGEIRYLKIPKAEVGKIVNPVEASLDWAKGKGGDVWSSIGSVLKSFSPIDNWGGVIPTAINPLVENAFNKDFYTGYDLVPEYKENYPKAYQDSSYTGPLYRFAGQKLNMSPAKIQNLVEGYGGGMMRIADWGAGKILPDKYKSAKNEQGADINRTPVLRRFMGGEKKTEQEQIKATESRINAINFDINDIKAGVKRGDIPMEVGVEKIEELQKQQKDLSASASIQSNTNTTSGQNLQWIQTKDGALKQIDFNFTVPELKLTGNTTLDKEIRSDFSGAITSLKNDVMTALEAGAITEEEAITQLEKLNTAKNKSKGPKKPKKITFKAVKYKAPKITIKKKSSVKLPSLKVKKPKKIKIVRRYTIKA